MYHPYDCGGGDDGHRGRLQQAPVNIQETEREYILQLYAPSLKKEAISITTKGDVLTIQYEDPAKEAEQFTRREFHLHRIDRSFDLKGKVNIDAIEASYAEGILKIILPKTAAAQRTAQSVEIG